MNANLASPRFEPGLQGSAERPRYCAFSIGIGHDCELIHERVIYRRFREHSQAWINAAEELTLLPLLGCAKERGGELP
jgi:hypothetical protein